MNNILSRYKWDEGIIKNISLLKGKDRGPASNFRINKYTYFLDNIWDFTDLNKLNRSKEFYKYNFDGIPNPYVMYVKMLILNELIIKKNAFGTTSATLNKLKTITNELNVQGVIDVRLIDKPSIETYMNVKLKSCKTSYLEGLAIALRKLILIIESIEGYDYKKVKEYLNGVAEKCRNSRAISTKNDFIPDEFLNQIMSLAIKDIENPLLDKDEKIVCCLLIIMAETGMRIEEVTLLETGQLKKITVRGKEIAYLKFLTFKTQQNVAEGKETYTWLSDKAMKAYVTCEKIVNEVIDNLNERRKMELLLKLHTRNKELKKLRELKKSHLKALIEQIDKKELDSLNKECRKYLFISAKNGTLKKGTTLLRENIQKFFIRHYKDINMDIVPKRFLKNIKLFHIISETKYKKVYSVEERKKLSFNEVRKRAYPYVNPHMFRVTVCTKLFMKGVHLDYIVKHMNHLSEDMTIYYNKSNDFIDKLTESMNIFASISKDDGLIETDVSKVENQFLRNELNNELVHKTVEKINTFLINNKLSIKKDLKKIISMLERANSFIVENEFGLCIRTVVHGICERKKYFSSISDYYYIGVQLPTYRYIQYSYERFKQKQLVVEHNKRIADKDDRYLLEYEREVNALKNFATKTLKEEIRLLEQDLQEFGIEQVLSKHPNIKSIIANLNQIRMEIEQWSMK